VSQANSKVWQATLPVAHSKAWQHKNNLQYAQDTHTEQGRAEDRVSVWRERERKRNWETRST